MARWFRHYVGMMRDGKIVGIAVRTRQTVERVGFIWACILEDSAERNDGGAYQLDRDGIAFFLRADPDEVSLILSEMEGAGLVAKGKVCKWAARQHESDSSASRMRRHRAKRQDGDGVVTSPDRHFVTCDGLEAEADTEGETKKEKQAAASLSIGQQNDDPERPALADEQLLARLLTAIGRSGPVPPAMRDLGPIRALLAEGCDLDRDVIALLTAKRATGKAKAAQSWAYFAEAIREHRAKAAPAVVAVDRKVWIGVEDPRWPTMAARYAAENHGEKPPTDRLNGWHFLREWLGTEAPPAQQPGRRRAAVEVHTEALARVLRRRHGPAEAAPIDADYRVRS